MIPAYTITYSNRKTLSIQIKNTGELIVRAPLTLTEKKVHQFIASKKNRIIQKIEFIKTQEIIPKQNITQAKKESALIQILPRIEYYAKKMNLSQKYTTIKITTANAKRGSCSSRGALMFHWKLSEFPIIILDYVIVHELAHLIHFNHSKEFWALVEEYYPTYQSAKKRLQDN